MNLTGNVAAAFDLNSRNLMFLLPDTKLVLRHWILVFRLNVGPKTNSPTQMELKTVSDCCLN